jgi:7,8-dihydropterin-6-yl-methyl-4-(beta-D-ribofuranosyl)aminobenzene 5'-phosphate synthase
MKLTRAEVRRALVLLALATLALPAALPGAPGAGTEDAAARAVKVTVLSTMLADRDGIGEWGFAAIVEVDGYRLLYDTGARKETVLRNAEELKVDLTDVTDVVLSHHHGDHTGGLMTLRQAMRPRNPAALSRAHVGKGIFEPRRYSGDATGNPMPALRAEYEATGAKMIEHASAERIAPAVWLTGPVKRRFPERNYPKGATIVSASGDVEDSIPEDLSLVVRTRDGLVVVNGCGHAGIGNILAQTREMVPGAPVRAVIGGLHLLDADDRSLEWTAGQMRGAGLKYLLGAHCTGLEAVYRLRALLGLDRRSVVVGAVGSSYSSDAGIDALWLAH